jgi:hypothetical protein
MFEAYGLNKLLKFGFGFSTLVVQLCLRSWLMGMLDDFQFVKHVLVVAAHDHLHQLFVLYPLWR